MGQRHPRRAEEDHGLRAPNLSRRGPALPHPQGDGARARLPADRDRRAARGGCAGGARAAQARPSAEDERRVLLRARPRHRRRAAAASARHVRVLADEGPSAGGSALLDLERRSRDSPGVVNAVRPLLHKLVNEDPNAAVRKLAAVCLKNGSPQRETIVLLAGLSEDDRLDRDLREVAAKVAASLKKKAGTKG